MLEGSVDVGGIACQRAGATGDVGVGGYVGLGDVGVGCGYGGEDRFVDAEVFGQYGFGRMCYPVTEVECYAGRYR